MRSSRKFFPENAVEYFVSYYDYYQPEAYIPHTDTFIEKDAAINGEIERLRHSATAALFERRDVDRGVIGVLHLRAGRPHRLCQHGDLPCARGRDARDQLRKLVEIRYERNDIAFDRNMFRVRGTRWRSIRCTPTDMPSGGVLRQRIDPFPRSTPSPVRPAGAPACGHLSRQPLCHHQGQDGAGGGGKSKELAGGSGL